MVVVFTLFITVQGLCFASANECSGFPRDLQNSRVFERQGSLSDSVYSNSSNSSSMDEVVITTHCEGWKVVSAEGSGLLKHSHGETIMSLQKQNEAWICHETKGNMGKNFEADVNSLEALIGTCAVVKQKRGSCSSPFGELYLASLMDQKYCFSRTKVSDV